MINPTDNQDVYSLIDQKIREEKSRPLKVIDEKIEALKKNPQMLGSVLKKIEKTLDSVETNKLSYDYVKEHAPIWMESVKKISEEKEKEYKKGIFGKIRYVASVFYSIFQGKGFKSSAERGLEVASRLKTKIEEEKKADEAFEEIKKELNGTL